MRAREVTGVTPPFPIEYSAMFGLSVNAVSDFDKHMEDAVPMMMGGQSVCRISISRCSSV
jgi:hypothetical protein